MPALKNARHERFAQELAKGKSATDALKAAGYSDPRNSTRLTKKDEIRRRVDELQAKVAKKVEVTVESLSAELDEARTIAKGEKQSGAMVQATMGKAKLFGLIIDKTRHSGAVAVITLKPQDLDKLTADELVALEAAYPVLEKLGIVGGTAAAEAAA
ncbi:MAG: hypothetical protein LOX97_08515 [Sphingomonas sp.]|nr:hypothetical protein [Sphingomonas sp.]